MSTGDGGGKEGGRQQRRVSRSNSGRGGVDNDGCGTMAGAMAVAATSAAFAGIVMADLRGGAAEARERRR